METVSHSVSRRMSWLVFGLLMLAVGSPLVVQWWPGGRIEADPADAAQVAAGKALYDPY